MTPDNEKRYSELTAILAIDLLRIDHEVSVTPQKLQEAAELAVSVGEEERSAKMARDIIMAEAGQRLRGAPTETGKPRSETQIDRELILEEDVQASRDIYERAQSEGQKCRALAENLREKSRLLGKACDMTIAGFITPSSYSPRRAELMKRPE